MQTTSFLNLSDHNYGRTWTQQPITYEELQPSTFTTKEAIESQITKKQQTTSSQPKRKKYNTNSLAIPLNVCHINWNITTNAQRKALLEIQHKPITRRQRVEHGKELIGLLTNKELSYIVDRSEVRTYKYNTHRIIYLHRSSKPKEMSIDTTTAWKKEFQCQPHLITSEVKSHKRRNEAASCKKEILNLLKEPYLSLFHQIETQEISFDDYRALRKHVFSIHLPKRLNVKYIFFPGVVYFGKQKESSLITEVHPTYKIASKTYLKLTKTHQRTARMLTTEEAQFIKNLKTVCCSSLHDLEQKASEAYTLMCPSSFSIVLHQAVSNMEKAGLLPIDKTTDFNDPYIIDRCTQQDSMSQQQIQQETGSTSDIQASTTHEKHHTKRKITKAKFKVKTYIIPKEITTTKQREAFLLLKYQTLSKEQKQKPLNILKEVLNKNTISSLSRHTPEPARYETHRIICLTQATSSHIQTKEEIWNNIFTSKKHIQTDRSDRKHYNEIQKRRTELLSMLEPPFQKLLLLLESFSISLDGYSQLRSHVQQITTYKNKLIRTSLFPGIVIVNKKKESPRTAAAHPAYKLAAQAYFQATHTKKGTSKTHTREQKAIILKLKEHLYTSLSELEKDVSTINDVTCWTNLKNLLNIAIHKMEQAGILPMTKSQMNDPFVQHKYALAYAQKIASSKPDTIISQQTEPATQKRKHKPSQQPTTKKQKTSQDTSIPNTSTSRNWTEQCYTNDANEVRQAAMALLSLSTSIPRQKQ